MEMQPKLVLPTGVQYGSERVRNLSNTLLEFNPVINMDQHTRCTSLQARHLETS